MDKTGEASVIIAPHMVISAMEEKYGKGSEETERWRMVFDLLAEQFNLAECIEELMGETWGTLLDPANARKKKDKYAEGYAAALAWVLDQDRENKG